MKTQGRGAKQRHARFIGAFLLGALVLAVVAVIAIGGTRVFRAKRLAIIYFDRSVNGLAVGSPVKFKGIEVGRVEKISLSFPDPEGDISDFRIPVIIDIHTELLTDRGVPFDLRDPAVHQRLIEHGLRAHLAAVSYVTGSLYVGLDFDEGAAPARFVHDPAFPYPEVPSRPNTIEEVQANVSRIMERLSAADVPLLIDSITTMAGALTRVAAAFDAGGVAASTSSTLRSLEQALDEVTGLARMIGGGIGPAVAQLDSTSRSARTALLAVETAMGDVRATTDPEGALFVRTEEAMLELARAARSFRELVEAIERNPSILLRGRAGDPPR